MNYNVVGPDGAVYGPVDMDGLKKWAAENRITPTSTLEEVGTGRRFAANTIPDLFPQAQPFSNPVIQPGPPQGTQTGYSGPQSYGTSVGGVSQSAQYPRGVPQQAPIPNNLAKAIFATLCCCLPLGIVAIVNAAQVSSKQSAGDYYGAQQSAQNADKYANISIGIGVVLLVIRVILIVVTHR